MARRISVEWREYMVLASVFTLRDFHRWDVTYAEFRQVMIKIGFADVPLVPLVLRPTGRLAVVHSGPFLYNENNFPLTSVITSVDQDRLAHALQVQWGISIYSFSLLPSPPVVKSATA